MQGKASYALILLLCCVSTSFGMQTVEFQNYSGPHGLGGGEFTLKNTSSSAIGTVQAGQTWQTFCLEYPEHIQFGVTYYGAINTGAVRGGNSGQTTPNYDPLDARTAYLYSRFRQNTLSNYNHDDYSAKNLQVAIWKLENELDDGNGNTFTDINYDDYQQAKEWVNEATSAVDSGQWSGLGNVRVINLYSSTGGNRQDQLIIVPAPTSFVLATLGLGLVGYLRRRQPRLAKA